MLMSPKNPQVQKTIITIVKKKKRVLTSISLLVPLNISAAASITDAASPILLQYLHIITKKRNEKIEETIPPPR